MKFFFPCMAVVVLLTASAAAKETEFPKAGTPYAEVRADLLRQGLKIAPNQRTYASPEERSALKKKGITVAEPAPSPDPQFREIDCWKHDSPRRPDVTCRALFLETDERGWKTYVIIMIEPQTKAVTSVDYPSTADGLPSIPPPLAKDVPQLKGSYFKTRKTLRTLGFRPAQVSKPDIYNGRCIDRACKHEIPMTEANCSGTGMAFCSAFWLAADGRVLLITTIGEIPKVYYVEWSSQKELRQAMQD